MYINKYRLLPVLWHFTGILTYQKINILLGAKRNCEERSQYYQLCCVSSQVLLWTYPKIPLQMRQENAVEWTFGVGTVTNVENSLDACLAFFIVPSTLNLELRKGWMMQHGSCAGVGLQIRNINSPPIAKLETWILKFAALCILPKNIAQTTQWDTRQQNIDYFTCTSTDSPQNWKKMQVNEHWNRNNN